MTARLLNVGRKLHARVQDFFDAAPDATAPPLELLQAALDQLERKAQPSGRGTRTFPYDRIVVHVAQPDPDRTAIESVFAQLSARLRERLAELRCDMPAHVQIRVAFDESAPEGRPESRAEGRPDSRPMLWVECSSAARSAHSVRNGVESEGDGVSPTQVSQELVQPQLHLSVMRGQCERVDYMFEQQVIAIGRGADPTDTSGRVRRNHVAFLEVRDGASETVARAHARLEFDPELNAYVLFNESSSNPTFVRRDGRSLRVAPRDPRGVRVQSGDELQLGRASLKLTVVPV
jgi:hypothetical protein